MAKQKVKSWKKVDYLPLPREEKLAVLDRALRLAQERGTRGGWIESQVNTNPESDRFCALGCLHVASGGVVQQNYVYNQRRIDIDEARHRLHELSFSCGVEATLDAVISINDYEAKDGDRPAEIKRLKYKGAYGPIPALRWLRRKIEKAKK